MAMSDVRGEQRTIIKFCYESGMSPVDTLKQVNQVINVTGMYQGLSFTSYFQDFVMECLQQSVWGDHRLKMLETF